MLAALGSLLMFLKGMFIGPIAGFLFLFYHLHPVLCLYECIAGGVVLGYCVAAWMAYIFCAVVGGTSSMAIRLSYTAITLIMVYYAHKIIQSTKQIRSTLVLLRRQALSEVWLNVLIGITAIFFWRVFYIHTIYSDEFQNLWSGGSTWSDLSFHLNVINSYIYGQNQEFTLWSTPRSVIFAGSGMSYPFIPDWHSVSLVVAGASDVRWAILFPSFLISLSFVVILFCFCRRFLSSSETTMYLSQTRKYNGTSFLAVLLFMTLSGYGGFTILRDRKWTWDTAFYHDSTQFTSEDSEIYWFHPICHILLPQRSALFAYPLVILVSSCIYQAVNDVSYITPSQKKKLFLISGFITGLLPLIHAHSLLCLAMIFIPYALMHPIRSFSINKETGLFVHWLRFGVPILVESALQIPVYLDRLVSDSGESHSSFITYNPIVSHGPWNRFFPGPNTCYNVFMNFWTTWIRAIGPFLPLAIIGCFFLDRKQLKLYVSFWVIFVVSNFIQFQPWDKDNTKLFVIWVFVAIAVVCLVLVKMWNAPSFVAKILVVFLLISMMLSGTMMLYREGNMWWQFMDPEDQNLGDWIAAHTDPEDVFIVNDSHIHPATNLGGKTALVNMAGWVQSHGYPDMYGRYRDQRGILSKPRLNYHLFQKHNISYIAKDEKLVKGNGMDEDFFAYSDDVELVFASSKYSIYDVTKISQAE